MPVAVASCNGTDTAAAVGRSDARARRPPTHRPRHQQPDRPSLIKRRPPSPAAAPAPRHGRATPHRGSPWSRTSAVHRAPSPSSHAPRKKTGHGPTIRPGGQTPGLPTRRAFKRGRHRRKRWGTATTRVPPPGFTDAASPPPCHCRQAPRQHRQRCAAPRRCGLPLAYRALWAFLRGAAGRRSRLFPAAPTVDGAARGTVRANRGTRSDSSRSSRCFCELAGRVRRCAARSAGPAS
jgi:hypothetical protein